MKEVIRLGMNQEEIIGIADMYKAIGVIYPNDDVICNGNCKGTGLILVCGMVGNVDGLGRKCDCWHFVKCPDCNGRT